MSSAVRKAGGIVVRKPMVMKLLKITGKLLLGVLGFVLLLLLAAFLFLTFYDGVGAVPDRDMRKAYAERTALFDGKRFHNANDVAVMAGESSKQQPQNKPDGTIPVVKQEGIPDNAAGALQVTWLGHSSALIQLGTKTILMDPVLTTYASPVSFTGAKRFSEIPIQPEALPPLDIVLLSHDHYDHLDRETILAIDSKVKAYIVPLGLESYLLDWDIDSSKIHSVGWWDSVSLSGIDVTATPAQHFTGRNPLKDNATWWCGYYFRDDTHSVYFSGDSGYSSGFSEIGERFGGVDLALLECGQYNTAWPSIHMHPRETVQAAKDVKAKWMVPVHWGVFSLSTHAWNEPPRLATTYAREQGVSIAIPKIGETVSYDDLADCSAPWWERLE